MIKDGEIFVFQCHFLDDSVRTNKKMFLRFQAGVLLVGILIIGEIF